jgi:type IV pilus assembly protein PilY1
VLDDQAVRSTSPNPLQNQVVVAGRSSLQPGTVSTAGTVTVPAFTLGAPPTTTPNVKSGWYFDLNATAGERQVSDITAVNGRLLFGSLFPTRGSCGEGGGRIYSVEALTGNGYSEESQVGVLAAPLVLSMGNPQAMPSGTTGRRMTTDKTIVISQGAKGLLTTSVVDTYSYTAGRMSWRLVNNHPTN